jgi:hypothetical protein
MIPDGYHPASIAIPRQKWPRPIWGCPGRPRGCVARDLHARPCVWRTSSTGRTYEGRVFDEVEYVRVESLYVDSVQRIMKLARVEQFTVTGLEVYGASARMPLAIERDTRHQLAELQEGCLVSGGALDWVVRLGLREALWCLLQGAQGAYIDFLHDYYIALGCNGVVEVESVLPTGMFVEPYPSRF